MMSIGIILILGISAWSFLIFHGHRFGAAILRRITSEEIRRIEFFGGSVSQLVESDDEVSNVQLCRKLRILYE